MALEAFLDEGSFASLPDAIREHYEKGDDGRHHLRVTEKDGWALQNVEALRGTARKEREGRETWERRHREETAAMKEAAKLLGRDEFDLDTFRESIEELDRLKKANPDEAARAKLEEMKKRLEAGHAAERKKLSGEVGSLRSENARLVLSRDVAEIVQDPKSSAFGADVALLGPHIEKMVRTLRDEESNRYSHEVLDDRGEPGRLSAKPGSTEKMGLRELLETVLRDRFPRAYPSSGAAGGRTGGTGGPARTGSAQDDNLSPTERLTRARARQASEGRRR